MILSPRFRRAAVAAVAADSVHIAEQAAALIKVNYEALPPVVDVSVLLAKVRS